MLSSAHGCTASTSSAHGCTARPAVLTAVRPDQQCSRLYGQTSSAHGCTARPAVLTAVRPDQQCSRLYGQTSSAHGCTASTTWPIDFSTDFNVHNSTSDTSHTIQMAQHIQLHCVRDKRCRGIIWPIKTYSHTKFTSVTSLIWPVLGMTSS